MCIWKDMEPVNKIESRFETLRNIAQSARSETLNDGEASHIYHKVSECAHSIEQALTSQEILDSGRMKVLKRELKEIEYLFRSVFTAENERMFPSLREAHTEFNELSLIVSLDEKCPGLRRSFLNMVRIVETYDRNRDRRHVKFYPRQNRFVGMPRGEGTVRVKEVQKGIAKLEQVENQVADTIKKSIDALTQTERRYIQDKLDFLSRSIDRLYQEAPAGRQADHPKVFRYISNLIGKTEKTRPQVSLDQTIKETESLLIDADEFEFVEREEELRIGFHDFDPLLHAHELEQIGAYCREYEEDLLERVLSNTPFDRIHSLYLPKEETGLSRTIQILAPDDAKSPADLNLVVQLKHHTSKEEAPNLKRLVGQRGYRAAQHSLLIPFNKISRDGTVKPEEICHTTTLTPRIQSKGHILQILAQMHSGSQPLSPAQRRSLDSLRREVKYHNEFAGRGILPIYGSGVYSGAFTKGEDTIALEKMNMITPACFADLNASERASLTFQEKKQVIGDMISGLIRIHEKGYAHGNICPENMALYRGKQGIQGFLTGFEFTTNWNLASGGSPLYFPTDPRDQTFVKSSSYHDLYAASLILLGFLTDKFVFTPSREAVDVILLAREEAGRMLADPEALKMAAQNEQLPPEEYRSRLVEALSRVDDRIWTLPDAHELDDLLSDEILADRNPLLHTFVKTFFTNYSYSGDSLSGKHSRAIFPTEDYDPEIDYTALLLKELQKQISLVEGEDELKLEALIRSYEI